LAEAVKRELAAAEAERDEKRRKDAVAAEIALSEAEALAVKIDQQMAQLKSSAVEFESRMALVRRLATAGPQHLQLRGLLARAISTGLMGLPQHPDVLAPGERKRTPSNGCLGKGQYPNRAEPIQLIAKTDTADVAIATSDTEALITVLMTEPL
jgi:hypothetical protein